MIVQLKSCVIFQRIFPIENVLKVSAWLKLYNLHMSNRAWHTPLVRPNVACFPDCALSTWLMSQTNIPSYINYYVSSCRCKQVNIEYKLCSLSNDPRALTNFHTRWGAIWVNIKYDSQSCRSTENERKLGPLSIYMSLCAWQVMLSNLWCLLS